jgi:hypothetical protein
MRDRAPRPFEKWEIAMKKLLIVAPIAALALAACSQETEDNADAAGQEMGEAADAMGDTAGSMASDAAAGVDKAIDAAEQTAENVSNDMKSDESTASPAAE